MNNKYQTLACPQASSTRASGPLRKKHLMSSSALAGLVLALAPAAQAADVTWSGGAGNAWDTTSSFWEAGTTTYTEGDTAIFDGVVSGTVDLTADRTPEAVADGVTVSGANNYEFTGAGIIGGTGLTKSGTGTLTLSNTGNAYSGGTFINTAVAGGNIVATNAASLGTGTVFLDDDTNAAGLVLSLSNDSGTTWANDFKMLDGRYFSINVGGTGAAGTTHTFGNFLSNAGRMGPVFTGSDGYNLNVGSISGNHQLDISSQMNGELTIASVTSPGSSRPLNFYGSSTAGSAEIMTVTGDVNLTALHTVSYAFTRIGEVGSDRIIDLTVDGIYRVGNSVISGSTFTSSSSGTMLFDIVGDGTGVTSSEIIGTLGGTETLNLLGMFDFDLTEATESLSTVWQVVGANIDTVTYDAAFTVDGWTDAGSGVWTNPTAGSLGIWQFSESTGQLTMVPVPDPASDPEITSITSLGGGVFELKLEGEPSTSYEFYSSATLDFTSGTSGTLVAPLTVTLGTGGPLDVTTDGSGDATVEASLGDLATVPANFVRAVKGL